MLRTALESALRGVAFDLPFRVVCPDGRPIAVGPGAPRFTVHLRTRRALRECVANSSVGFGEAYSRGDIDVEGDLQDVVRLGFAIENRLQPTIFHRVRRRLRPRSQRNTIAQVKRNVAAHYDVGNDFFARWLDREMLYTCAYFQDADDSLEDAQRQKMDLVCRKLRLVPGETVIEVGCGWGALALHMARHYGVRVKAFNVSKEQLAYARGRQQALGIGTDRVEYILDDWRTIRSHASRCDKFVAICMIEHVDPRDYPRYFALVHEILEPTGAALLQFISRTAASRSGNRWLEKRVFPGNYNPSLAQLLTAVESADRPLHVVDVESLRYHYALTLDHWHERFESHADWIRDTYGEPFLRRWRLYLRAMAAGYRAGGTLLYQVLLAAGYDNAAPLTRHHMLGLSQTPTDDTAALASAAVPAPAHS